MPLALHRDQIDRNFSCQSSFLEAKMGQVMSSVPWKLSTMVDLQQRFDQFQNSQQSQCSIPRRYQNCHDIFDVLKLESRNYCNAFNKIFNKIAWTPRRGSVAGSFAHVRRFIAYLVSEDGLLREHKMEPNSVFVVSLSKEEST